MYSVLLIDDEPWALVGIRSVFPWNAFGFDVKAEFSDSEEALRWLSSNDPDVVVTDIRMPDLTGIDLMKAARGMGKTCEFIVVSGYMEFSYAQEAIQAGAFDYCLKPVESDSTEKLLNRLKDHLDQHRKSQDTKIVHGLLAGFMPLDDLLARCAFEFARDTCILVYSDAPDENTVRSDLNVSNQSSGLWLAAGDDVAALLLCIESEQAERVMPKDTQHKLSWCYGVSRPFLGADGLPGALAEARSAYQNRYITGMSGLYRYVENYQRLIPVLNNLDHILSSRNEAAALKCFQSMNELFKQHGMGMCDLEFFYRQVRALLYKQFQQYAGKGYFAREQKDLFNSFSSLQDILKSLEANCRELLGGERQALSLSTVQANFQELLAFIDANYQRDISLKELSERYHIHFSYCSELFKKHTGVSYSDYVTNRRIEKAKELLALPSPGIEEISRYSGYHDYYYFLKVFKKQTGLSPAQYRKSKGQGRTYENRKDED